MGSDAEIEPQNGVKIVRARTRAEWRKWLEDNCRTEKSARLIIYHKKSKTPSVLFEEAIEEATCFGWVDSKTNRRDEESFYLLFSPRNPRSTWGKISKARTEKMIREGWMTPCGQAVIDQAKANGAWQALEDAHNAVIPPDLQELFDRDETAYRNFQAFSESVRRNILEWILKAKKPETRQRRIAQTVALAARNVKAMR
jgi:uncharacterized protein YdeI (YjbR/CyaY-like superfamily)